jgi:ABC-2 type transport system ATP-binding protein
MLKIDNLTKYYGDILGVKNISLELNKGEIFGFIGPNGSGKSTTIRCIMNMINKDSGTIFIDNIDHKNNEKIKPLIGYLPGEVHLYDDLTVKELLEYNQSFYSEDYSKRTKYLANKLELDMNKKIDELSFGNTKKVGIVLAIMHEPKLIILDEPTSGLDPLMQEVFFEILKEEQKRGATIFFSSHILGEVKRVCDRVGIIKNGELIKIESMDKITKTDFSIVTVVSEDYKLLKLPMKDIVIKDRQKDKLKFIYKGNINDLLSILTTIKVKDLLIEEPTLEEVFMHYYK